MLIRLRFANFPTLPVWIKTTTQLRIVNLSYRFNRSLHFLLLLNLYNKTLKLTFFLLFLCI